MSTYPGLVDQNIGTNIDLSEYYSMDEAVAKNYVY